jgi:hypothetical protein
MTDYDKALSLLTRCNEGFSAFVNGRKLARKDRDKLRADIADFLARARRLAEQQPVAFGLFAKVEDGSWHLQHPERFTEEDAKADRAMYDKSTLLRVEPLYAAPVLTAAPVAEVPEHVVDLIVEYGDSRYGDSLVQDAKLSAVLDAINELLAAAPQTAAPVAPACGTVNNGVACSTPRWRGERLCPDCNPNPHAPAAPVGQVPVVTRDSALEAIRYMAENMPIASHQHKQIATSMLRFANPHPAQKGEQG